MRVLALAVLVAVLGAVTGCASGGANHIVSPGAPVTAHPRSSSPRVVAVYAKLPKGLDLSHGAAFLSPTRLVIVSWGSGNCPNVPKRLTVVNPSSIRIRLGLRKPANGICFADLRSIPVVIAIDPKRIDVHRPLTIRLGNHKPIVRVAQPLS